MKESELKPCPLCRSKVNVWQDEDPYGPGGPIPTDWVIDCPCGLSLRKGTRGTLIKAWNNRTPKKRTKQQ